MNWIYTIAAVLLVLNVIEVITMFVLVVKLHRRKVKR